MKTVLVTGANGFLGQHLCLTLKEAGFNVVATGRGGSKISAAADIVYESAELTNVKQVDKLLDKYQPNTIIHNAAMSKPDECEANRDLCLQNNVETTKTLLEAGSHHFIYISTDFVFGEDGPHSEDAEPGPLNFYGQSKLMAEQLVMQYNNKTTIVRPAFIYGKIWEGIRPTFLHWVKNSLTQQKTINVVNDQLRTPTFVNDICTGVEKIITLEATGAFNLAGKDILTPHEMAVKTAEILGLDTALIKKVTSETFYEPVQRAKRSGLKIEKAVHALEYQPVSFEEGIRQTFA